jgi:hypothetical protein
MRLHETLDYSGVDDSEHSLLEDSLLAEEQSSRASSEIFGEFSKLGSFVPGLGSLGRRRLSRSLPIVNDLLTQQQGYFLIDIYLQGYHPLVPLIHKPSFLEQCSYLFEEGRPNAIETWESTGLMLAVCFAGVIACGTEQLAIHFPDKSKEKLAKEMCKLSMRFVQAAGFPGKPTLRTLTAYIICQSTWLRG